MKIANRRMIIAALALLSGASAFGASGSVMADKTTGALAAPANFFTANAAAIQAVVGAAGQTPWTTDIDADGRALTNVASISSGSANPFLLTMGDRAPSTAGYKQAQMAVATNSITTNYVMLLPNHAFDGLGYLERVGGADTNPVVRWRKGVAGTEYVTPATQTGTHASPSTTNPLAPTWTGPLHTIWYGATGEIDLPAASGYAGKAILIYNTGAFTVTIDPNASEVIVRDGAVQTGGVTMTLSSGAGNYVSLFCDGARWVTLGFKGTLAAGS